MSFNDPAASLRGPAASLRRPAAVSTPGLHVAVVGLGTTGSQVARQFRSQHVARITLFDTDSARIGPVRGAMDSQLEVVAGPPRLGDVPDVTILAGPVGSHLAAARSLVAAGAHVVSLSDDPDEVKDLLALDQLASENRCSLVVGAGFCPGFSEVLARWAADSLDTVDSISVATSGTGGPACARQHHRALKGDAYDWRDGSWERRRGGSGRVLAWFPDPIGALDTYFASLASPILLHRCFPDVERLSARVSANRRDRLTGRLPMLRPPHRDGGPGAVRVEVRGRRHGGVETLVFGAMAYPSVASAIMSSVAAMAAARGLAPLGAHGLARWDDPASLLAELHQRGMQVASFNGEVGPVAQQKNTDS